MKFGKLNLLFNIIAGLSREKSIISDAEINEVSKLHAKVAGIKEVLARDHMKVM